MSLFVSLARQIDQWQSQGLLDKETADRLRDDVNKRSHDFGMGGVLAVLGAMLLGAALILFVAANWEFIPRLWRVCLILAVMWGSYFGGAWLEQREYKASGKKQAGIFVPSLYLLGALTYGAGIALVGQMYHISGDMMTAALAWGIGVLFASFLLRSGILCTCAVIIGGFYVYVVLQELGGQLNMADTYRWVLPLYILGCGAALIYTQSRMAMHFLAMLTLAYPLILYFDIQSIAALDWMIVTGAVLIICQGRWSSFNIYSRGFGSQLAGYGLAAILIALAIMQVEFSGLLDDSRLSTSAIYSLVAIAACVLALIVAGARSGQLRWFAYAGFSLHVLYLGTVTVGSMISTSGVFLIAGALIMALAYLMSRIERHMRKSHADDLSGHKGMQP